MALEMVIIRKVLHDVLNTALQDVAEPIDGIDLNILVLPKPVDLGSVYVEVRVQIILRDAPLLHSLPQTVIFYHPRYPQSLDFSLLSQ